MRRGHFDPRQLACVLQRDRDAGHRLLLDAQRSGSRFVPLPGAWWAEPASRQMIPKTIPGERSIHGKGKYTSREQEGIQRQESTEPCLSAETASAVCQRRLSQKPRHV